MRDLLGAILTTAVLPGVLLISAACDDEGSGNRTAEPFSGPCVVEIDDNGDGVIGRREVYEYGDEQRLVRITTYRGDEDEAIPPSDVPSAEWTFHYDGNGFLVLERYFDLDPQPSLISYYEYENNDSGQPTRIEYFRLSDGEPIPRLLRLLDYEDGRLVFEREYDAYYPHEEIYQSRDDYRYLYNAAGLLEVKEYYFNADNDPDELDRAQYYYYDEDNFLVREIRDSFVDGIYEYTYVFSNDKRGYVVREEGYYMPENVLGYVARWDRDESSNPLVYERHAIAPEEYEYEYYYYDCWEAAEPDPSVTGDQ